MISYFPTLHVEHQPKGEFWNSHIEPLVEVSQRVDLIRQGLVQSGLGDAFPVSESSLDGISHLLEAVHSSEYLAYLKTAYQHWIDAGGNPDGVMPFIFAGRGMEGFPDHPLARPGYFAFDMGAWILSGTFSAAAASAHTAVHAAEQICQGTRSAYALCRPPGHHTGIDFYGGYCYLNNAAIAAEHFRLSGGGRQYSRVAILDVDLHHGNGTQHIYYRRADVLCVSLHIDPAFGYPFFAGYAHERGRGPGKGYNINYPLPLRAEDGLYLRTLDIALDQIGHFDPSVVVVSLGVDTYAGDPIGKLALTPAAYPQIGRKIASLYRPTLFVQEGGYALDRLGELVTQVLVGFEQSLG